MSMHDFCFLQHISLLHGCALARVFILSDPSVHAVQGSDLREDVELICKGTVHGRSGHRPVWTPDFLMWLPALRFECRVKLDLLRRTEHRMHVQRVSKVLQPPGVGDGVNCDSSNVDR